MKFKVGNVLQSVPDILSFLPETSISVVDKIGVLSDIDFLGL